MKKITVNPKFLLLALLMASRWVVYGFTGVALVAILRRSGVELTQISLLGGAGFLFMFKFLWAPIVDRVRIFQLPPYKGWYLLSQSVCALSLIALLWLHPKDDFYLVFACLVGASLAASFRDIAQDGLSVKILNEDERPTANGYMSAGFMVGMVLGGGVMLAMYDTIGWTGAVWTLFVSTVLPVPFAMRFHESEASTSELIHTGKSSSMLYALFAFFRYRGNMQWAGHIMLMTLAGITGPSLLVLILVDNGWSLTRVGVVTNIVGPLIAATLSLAAGYVFARTTRRVALVSMITVGAFFSFAKVPIVSNSYPEMLTITVIVLAVVVASLTNLAQKVVVIDKATSSNDFGTNFTIQGALNQTAGTIASVVAPALASVTGYANVIIGAGVLGLISALLLSKYKYL